MKKYLFSRFVVPASPRRFEQQKLDLLLLPSTSKNLESQWSWKKRNVEHIEISTYSAVLQIPDLFNTLNEMKERLHRPKLHVTWSFNLVRETQRPTLFAVIMQSSTRIISFPCTFGAAAGHKKAAALPGFFEHHERAFSFHRIQMTSSRLKRCCRRRDQPWKPLHCSKPWNWPISFPSLCWQH